MSNPRPVIMDCDPGLDDAIAIILAAASPDEIDIRGITTVFGNTPVAQSAINALKICELTGRQDLPVYAGCPRPLLKKSAHQGTYTAADIHGAEGLGGLVRPKPGMQLQSAHAVDFIIQTVRSSKEPITLLPTGSLTNIATALIMAPDIVDNIQDVILMGGVVGLGNITPAAEYNFYSDPHAAYVVFTSSLPITMFGLDLTRQVVTTPERVKKIKAVSNRVGQAVGELMNYFHRPDAYLEAGVNGGVLHDPNVVAYLLRPDLYKGKKCHVEIDISTSITEGRSTVDWYDKRGLTPNTMVINEVDADGFFDLLVDRLGFYDNLASESIPLRA